VNIAVAVAIATVTAAAAWHSVDNHRQSSSSWAGHHSGAANQTVNMSSINTVVLNTGAKMPRCA